MAKKERQRLNIVDLEELFPGETINIGGQTVDIRPLGVLQLAKVARQLKGFGKYLSDEGVTWDNYNQPEHLIKLAVLILEQFPNVLEEASNIAVEDLQELPIEYVVQILDTVITVNLKSKEALEGNFRSLAEKLNLVAVQSQEKQKLQKRSKN